MPGKQSEPTRYELAGMVLAGPWDTIRDSYESTLGCVAWVEKSNRRCGRDAPGYLCARHETVARRRWEKRAEQEWAAEMRRQGDRATRLPQWREELARLEAKIRAQGFSLPKNNLADVYDARNNPTSHGRRPTPGADLHARAEKLRQQIALAEKDQR